jgi:hypothetical protein
MIFKFWSKHLELLPKNYQRRIKVIYPNLKKWILLSNMNCHGTAPQERFPKLIIVPEVWEIRVHLDASTGLTTWVA